MLAHRVLPSTDAQLARRTVTDDRHRGGQLGPRSPTAGSDRAARSWRLFTGRGRFFLLGGIIVVLVAMVAGQRDVMRIGLLLAGAARWSRRSWSPGRGCGCPASAPSSRPRCRSARRCGAGSPSARTGRLPAAILMLEDAVPRELGNRPRFVVDRAELSWRREIEYPLLGRVRGRFRTGPLMVRTTDPFGLVQLDRQFVATTEVMVTPAGGDPARDALRRRRGQHRRGPAAPDRRRRPGRRAGPGVPQRRRRAPDPLALHRPAGVT